MDAHQVRVLESFRRVQGWFAANAQFTATSAASNTTGPTSAPALATQLAALDGIVARATAHAAEQDTQLAQSMLISKDERELRKEILAGHMGTIAKVARALRGQVPGIGVLTMPRGNIQSSALLNTATVMARKAEIYAAVLVEQGLPTDFVKQLDDAVVSLRASLDARGRARAGRAGATRGVQSELSLGRRVVDIMDATLSRALRNDSVKFAEWRHVKRVTLKGVSIRGGSQVAEFSPTVAESSPTEVQRTPTVVQGSPTAPQTSPTGVDIPPTAQQKAA